MVLDLFKLDGRKAIITGGSRGLGRAYGQALHEAGAEIVLIDILDKVRETVAEIGSGCGAAVHYVISDLLDRDSLDKGFRESLELLGGHLDILVNNAGINARGETIGYKMENWDRIIGLNLTTQFMMCVRAAEVMVKQGKGKIINVSSAVGVTGGVQSAAYSASKGGITTMTKTMSNEWAPMGINVNAIAPGYISTDLNSSASEERRKYITARIPKGYWGEPSLLKGTIVYLCSDAADYVTGVILPVDGGFLSR
jgi:2-deoxy-D-gluconate 3-dehydrogenase